LRDQDKALREQIAVVLQKNGWKTDTANQLANWDPYNLNDSAGFFDPEWMFDISDGFDVVIGNPPYLGQSGNKDVFREVKQSPLGKKFHQRRMDYFYFFFHAGIELCRDNGILTFITTNYFFNATYADKLREHINKECQVFNLIDFNEVKVFESAQGQHNAITFLRKSLTPTRTKYTYCNRKEIKDSKELETVLSYQDEHSLYSEINSFDVFNSNNHIDVKSKFELNKIDISLDYIIKSKYRIADFYSINQGIVTGGNKISSGHLKTFNLSASVGEGIFILTKEEINNLNLTELEKQYIKPWFKNSNVSQYHSDCFTNEFLIYYTSFNIIELNKIPNLINHFSRFKELLINRNIRTGQVTVEEYSRFVNGLFNIDYVMIKSTLQSGHYFAVSYARTQEIFESPKIVCPQRSYKNSFAYNEIPWYGASDLYFINSLYNSKEDLKTLLLILNSSLIFKWLYYKGQRKGEMLQLFKDPLSNIPLVDIRNLRIKPVLSVLADLIGIKPDSNYGLKVVADSCVLNLYFPDHMKERSIDILDFVERDVEEVIQGREFEKLSDAEKENVIDHLSYKWSHPDNEVRDRIKLFAVRSPDILKPILESK
jgi:adenine-specific DNA-methyltransferase